MLGRGPLLAVSLVATSALRICGSGDPAPPPPPAQVLPVPMPQVQVPPVPAQPPAHLAVPVVPGPVNPAPADPSAVGQVPGVPGVPGAPPTDPAAVAAADPNAEVVDPEPPPGSLPQPVHEGTVVAAGGNPVEVVTAQTGEVHAYVWRPASATPPYSELTVSVQGSDNQPHTVPMTWNPTESRYEGQLTGVTPVPGPVSVTFTLAGQRHTGRVARALVAARISRRAASARTAAAPEPPPAEPSPNRVERPEPRPEPEPPPPRPTVVRSTGGRPITVTTGSGVRSVAIQPSPGVRSVGPQPPPPPGQGVRRVYVQPGRSVTVQPSTGVRVLR